MNSYNVIVDLSGSSTAAFEDDAIHVEDIGPGQFQVGYGTSEHSAEAAYRTVANYIEARLALFGGDDEITHAHVYGPDNEEVVIDE